MSDADRPENVDSAPSILTSRLSKLNPFSKSKDGGEDLGEQVDFDSIGGGGHAARRTKITKGELRVSHALKKFLVEQGELTEEQAGLDSEKVCSQHFPPRPSMLDASFRLTFFLTLSFCQIDSLPRLSLGSWTSLTLTYLTM